MYASLGIYIFPEVFLVQYLYLMKVLCKWENVKIILRWRHHTIAQNISIISVKNAWNVLILIFIANFVLPV